MNHQPGTRNVLPGRWVLRAAAALGALALLLAGALPAAANHAWSTYHWGRASNPFTLTLRSNLVGGWESILPQVSFDWSQSSVLDTVVAAGDTSLTFRKRCPATSGRIEVCNAEYGKNGWLGLATIWLSGNHIVKATTKVNDTYFKTPTYDNPYAKRHVLCQEVGHNLGLDHQRDPASKSCMDDRNGLFDPAFVSPNAHDYQQLESIYTSHLDSTSTVKTASSAFRNDESAEALEAALPRSGGPGARTLFAHDLGGGRKIFIWVFWAR